MKKQLVKAKANPQMGTNEREKTLENHKRRGEKKKKKENPYLKPAQPITSSFTYRDPSCKHPRSYNWRKEIPKNKIEKRRHAYIAKIRTINTKVSNVREKENLRGDHQPGADRRRKREWSRVREGRKDAIRGTGEGIGEGLGFRTMEERGIGGGGRGRGAASGGVEMGREKTGSWWGERMGRLWTKPERARLAI